MKVLSNVVNWSASMSWIRTQCRCDAMFRHAAAWGSSVGCRDESRGPAAAWGEMDGQLLAGADSDGAALPVRSVAVGVDAVLENLRVPFAAAKE